MAITPRYYLSIGGGPKIGWPRTFASRAAALAAAAEANQRDGISADVHMVPSAWTIAPDGAVAWLIGGPAGLRYQLDVSAPWPIGPGSSTT